MVAYLTYLVSSLLVLGLALRPAGINEEALRRDDMSFLLQLTFSLAAL